MADTIAIHWAATNDCPFKNARLRGSNALHCYATFREYMRLHEVAQVSKFTELSGNSSHCLNGITYCRIGYAVFN